MIPINPAKSDSVTPQELIELNKKMA